MDEEGPTNRDWTGFCRTLNEIKFMFYGRIFTKIEPPKVKYVRGQDMGIGGRGGARFEPVQLMKL
ncbi:hypothetical protein NECAME_14458 [Necator americanus]|uniref:Uncharacterized protein n=1 Tax=Necator americanus TaxID=51031 RepID=W2SMH7_NECAM|nr:hypothetical protein NECAME_14458 [Necator americanus]ETN70884.1 hypothetical protein NECAME_14458 [Necator americanus]